MEPINLHENHLDIYVVTGVRFPTGYGRWEAVQTNGGSEAHLDLSQQCSDE